MCVEYTPVYNYNFPRRAQQTVKLATRGSGHEQHHRELVLCCTQHQPHHVLHRMSQQRWSSWTRVRYSWVLSFLFALYQPRAICAPTAKRLKGIFTVVFRVSHDLEMHSLIWATLRPCICLLTLCNLHFMSVQAGKKTKYSLQTCSRTSEAIENDTQALIIIYTSGEIHLGIWGIAVSENSMKSLRLL